MTKFPLSIPFLQFCVYPSNIPLCPKVGGFSWGRRHVASFQHPEVSVGSPMIVMVEEFSPAQTWAFLGFFFLSFFHHSPLPSPTAVWQRPPAPGTQRVMVCQAVTALGDDTPSPVRPPPALKLGQGRQQCLVPAQGLNQQPPGRDWILALLGQGHDFFISNGKIVSPSYGAPREIATEWCRLAFFLIFSAQSSGMCW